MTYSQKYTIVQLLEPLAIGEELSRIEWPLHITMADVFAVDLNTSLIEQLANLLATKAPLTIKTKEASTLGPDTNPVPVMLLRNTPELQSLHEDIISLLEDAGATFNTPEYTRKGFVPHVTVKKSPRLPAGETIIIDALTVIDMFPEGDWTRRKVLTTIPFGKST